MCYIDCDNPVASIPKLPTTMIYICPNCHHRFAAPNYCRERSEGINRKETEEQEKQNEKKEEEKEEEASVHSTTATCYVADLLVSHNYTNGDSSFINVPTIIHKPAIFQSAHRCSNVQFADSETMKLSCDAQTSARQNPSLRLPINQSNNQDSLIMTMKNIGYGMASSIKHVTTTCKPTNDSITFTTSPNIHSGGCLIQSTEAGILVQAPPIEIQRKLTGGGCLMQKKHLPNEDERLATFKYIENFAHQTFVTPPSGCLELPGSRRLLPSFKTTRENSETMGTELRQRKISIKTNGYCDCNGTIQQNICQCHEKLTDASDDRGSLLFEPAGNGMQIRVNANMQLPVNLSDCQINITATTAMPCNQIVAMKPRSRNKQERNKGINWKGTKEQEKQKKKKEEEKEKKTAVHSTTATCYVADLLVSSSSYTNDNDSFINVPTIIHEPAIFQSAHCFNAQFANCETVKLSNNFNESAAVQPDNLCCATEDRIITTGNNNGCNNNERKDGAPTISVSHPWVMSSPWSLDTKLLNKDIRLREIKRLLQTCGWYHENISWKQSENLLKNTSVGRWLMRDSSDSRYIFAISVQTARGPTSVRVCYFLKHFQFDAEPGLALAIPTFDCPITMLEHYVEYSERMDRREVWVDYSGELYSQIYLTKPLVKEVKSLSHLARLVVNRNKLPTEHLPLLIRNYLAEYPYTL